jgi:organic hydroperoxide reductase OsmC/OhrA/SAM-dependent methyltransferase
MVATSQQDPPAHHYSVTCSWSGSTGVGYEAYSREHLGTAPPAATQVRMSSDPAFRGDPALLNPEQLVVLAASSCQLLSFLAIAARARIDVRDYQDTGQALMVEDGRGGGAIMEITLRPRITVVTEVPEERLRRLVHLAHEQCFIAASLACPVTVEPVFEILAPYAFQDSEAAARRLAVVSEIFDPSSEAFVRSRVEGSGPNGVALAVDLGCGPGHTTRLLAAATGARRTIGLDASAAFLAAATGSAHADLAAGSGALEFARHDVRKVPFPAQARGADVGYARLLLAHLADVTTAIGGWLTQLSPHGVLLLDEVESIYTDQPALASYLAHARRLVAARGATLQAGPLITAAVRDLAAHPAMPRFAVEHDAIEELSPPAPAAAVMFGLNLAVWREDPLFRRSQAELDELAADLAVLAAAPADTGRITWALRRVALRRLGPWNGPAPAGEGD